MTQQTLKANRVVDPVLTESVRGYRQPNLVGNLLFPRVGVNSYGGKRLEFGKEDFRRYKVTRAPGTNTKRITAGHEGKDYAIPSRALEKAVPRELGVDAQNVPGIDLGQRASMSTMRILQNDMEYEQAELATDPANYAAANKVTLTTGDRWTQFDTSDPSKDIEEAREAVRSRIGVYPNVAIVSAKAMSACRQHPKILDRIKYTGRDSITAEMLAALWDIPTVGLGAAVLAGSDDTFQDAWGDGVVLAYAANGSLTFEEPSFGFTYFMTGHPLVEAPYWDENAKSWIYGTSDDARALIVGADGGFLISGAGDNS